ncbi:hypothetical protein L3Q82_000360 [Scortum barcoo]|uniref:Uncharacterized protein n=1 Tax=Scortum barcoo TaxID=214431 RepID=A0ACB8XA12_9TELE|nr:hypothetical protein L3Q82_000360 [Scortum barcoo]
MEAVRTICRAFFCIQPAYIESSAAAIPHCCTEADDALCCGPVEVCQELRGESSTFQLPEEEESLLSLLYQSQTSTSVSLRLQSCPPGEESAPLALLPLLGCCYPASIDKVSKVASPVLVIHGTEDEVIDFSHGLAMYERCPRAVEPLWVEGAGHNDIELYAQYLERLKQFISFELSTS